MDDLRGYVYATLLEPSPLARFQPQPRRRATYGVVHCVGVEGAGPGANAVSVLGPAGPDEVFRQADAFFGSPGQYSVTLDLEAAPEVDAALRAAGWELDEQEPALAMLLTGRNGAPTIPPPPAELAIRPVRTEAELDSFRDVTGTPPSIVPSLEAATAAGVALFIGAVDGQNVATSRPVVVGQGEGRVVDINGVVTRPEARRRGYATAMTWRAVQFGRDNGAVAAVLCATEMGYPVYRKMGFIPVCTFRTYVPPAAEG